MAERRWGKPSQSARNTRPFERREKRADDRIGHFSHTTGAAARAGEISFPGGGRFWTGKDVRVGENACPSQGQGVSHAICIFGVKREAGYDWPCREMRPSRRYLREEKRLSSRQLSVIWNRAASSPSATKMRLALVTAV